MAKPKKQKELRKWEPQAEGDTLEGKFIQFQATQNSMIMLLDTGAVSVGVVLRSFLAPVYRELKPGKDTLSLKFLGKSGRTKMFEVSLNGKPLERSFVPGKPAGEKDLLNFFQEDSFEV